MPELKNSIISTLIISNLEKHIKRINSIKDPVVKYRLFMEEIHSLLEIVITAYKLDSEDEIGNVERAILEQKDKDVGKKEKYLRELQKNSESIDNIVEELDKYFHNLTDWISQPQYSPDHPIGKEILDRATDEFNLLANKS